MAGIRVFLERARRHFFPTREELFSEYASWLEAERLHTLFVETGRQGGLKSAPTRKAKAEARLAEREELASLRVIAKTAQRAQLEELAKAKPVEVLRYVAEREEEQKPRRSSLRWHRVRRSFSPRSRYLHQIRARAGSLGGQAKANNTALRLVEEAEEFLHFLKIPLRKKEPSALDTRSPQIEAEARERAGLKPQ